MLTYIRPAFVMLALFTLLTGVAYPLAITGLAQLVLPSAANGSQLNSGGQVIGSGLIGQVFTSDKYFHGRPSAAGQNGYDALASSGSNLGPLSKTLLDRITADVQTLRGTGTALVPADAVTASGSGLDPHITPAYAAFQLDRVAKARGVARESIDAIVQTLTEQPFIGIIGEPRINVLQLNMALDRAIAPGAG